MMNNTPPPLPTAPAAAPKTGLAITSLVLGILGLFCLYILTGLPAIITGHMARARAKKRPEQYGGAGLALAGLILGYLSILTTLFAGAIILAVALPAIAQNKRQAQGFTPGPAATPTCVNNLKQIGLAARIWSNDHNDTFPTDFLTMSNELIAPKILVCPDDQKHTVAPDWPQFDPKQHATYEFLLPGAKEADAMSKPAFRCPIHGHVGLGDGSVQPSGTTRRR